MLWSGRRLDNPDDFITIEIATPLARNIRVIPVLVDGARMPKAGELPDPLKALARRQAVEVLQLHFGRDAEALVERVNEALDDELGWQRPWRGKTIAGVAGAVLLLLGWIAVSSFDRRSTLASMRKLTARWSKPSSNARNS